VRVLANSFFSDEELAEFEFDAGCVLTKDFIETLAKGTDANVSFKPVADGSKTGHLRVDIGKNPFIPKKQDPPKISSLDKYEAFSKVLGADVERFAQFIDFLLNSNGKASVILPPTRVRGNLQLIMTLDEVDVEELRMLGTYQHLKFRYALQAANAGTRVQVRLTIFS